MNVQDQITSVLNVPAMNALEAELIESQLEACERALSATIFLKNYISWIACLTSSTVIPSFME